MPQPVQLDALQEDLLSSYRSSWSRILAEQERLASNPKEFRKRARLQEMRKAVERELFELDSQAAQWVAERLPQAYAAGMASTPGATSGIWSLIHQEAVEELGIELFKELLAATDGVRDSTKQLVRTVARDQALQKAIQGKTAEEASREMRRVLQDKGIFSVTYRDGSKHGLAEYTQVAMRTTTAKAYNRGTLNAHDDVKFFEVFDGPNCGLTKHDDPQLALGMVVDRSTCEQYPISHPNCRRAFGPRPDITRSDFAEKANPTSTAAQRQAQLEQDRERGLFDESREPREDVFTKREKRLEAQREKVRQQDRLAAQRDKEKRLAERQAKLDARAKEAAAKKAAAEAGPKMGLPEGEVALLSRKVPKLDVDQVTTSQTDAGGAAGYFIHRDGRNLGAWQKNAFGETFVKGADGSNRYFTNTKDAAQYLLDDLKAQELIKQASKPIVLNFPTMRPQLYDAAVAKANPGRVNGPEFLNNCHYATPTMELRARGYDVIAEPTFQRNGRYQHSIAKDWFDPATGKYRPFTRVGLKRSELKGGKYVIRDLTPDEIYAGLVERTKDWPPGARGFITGDWKTGSAHIWNMYKDEAGVLRFADGQVNKPDVREYLGRISAMQILRVDDLQPVAERVGRVSRSADKGPRSLAKAEQIDVGLRQLAQMYDDYGDSSTYATGYQVQMDKHIKALKALGVKDPYAEAQKFRQAP